jgi:hypothetical protein
MDGQSRLLFATRYSPLAAVSPIANRQSPFAAVFFHLFEVLMTCAGMMLGRPIP